MNYEISTPELFDSCQALGSGVDEGALNALKGSDQFGSHRQVALHLRCIVHSLAAGVAGS